jgi:hypothetical protein
MLLAGLSCVTLPPLLLGHCGLVTRGLILRSNNVFPTTVFHDVFMRLTASPLYSTYYSLFAITPVLDFMLLTYIWPTKCYPGGL